MEDVAQERAGVRLYDNAELADLLKSGSALADMAATHLGPAAMPVRAILFDKTPATSWALGWHQDRTVAVRDRIEVPGWGPWSTKSGVHHVEPPFAVIEQMVTLRVHLDRVPIDNAPLLVAPGSHRFGRVAQREIDGVVKPCGTATCLAERGDVWV